MKKNSKYWIEKLDLQAHPEGGYFKEIYRSQETILSDHLPKRFGGNRAFSTAIYFLLENDNFSAFHSIKSDEVWHFYAGDALLIHIIDNDGNYSVEKFGQNLEKGEKPQFVVPAGVWFAAEVKDKNSYALVGCTVAPGFDFEDFEMAKREELTKKYPQNEAIIRCLTR